MVLVRNEELYVRLYLLLYAGENHLLILLILLPSQKVGPAPQRSSLFSLDSLADPSTTTSPFQLLDPMQVSFPTFFSSTLDKVELNYLPSRRPAANGGSMCVAALPRRSLLSPLLSFRKLFEPSPIFWKLRLCLFCAYNLVNHWAGEFLTSFVCHSISSRRR